jgi:RimJ/RimL family protein N-acetyltransferase
MPCPPIASAAPAVRDDRCAWRLRPASLADVDGLHALAGEPAVYRYLFDGAAPSREAIASAVAGAMADAAQTGLGLWILASDRVRYAGCAQLRPDMAAGSAELLYLLHPSLWGRGLATRMAWTAITAAFQAQIDLLVAGTDSANVASLAVMRRLGMRFRREVSYPLGRGEEYALHRDDPGPEQPPAVLPIEDHS